MSIPSPQQCARAGQNISVYFDFFKKGEIGGGISRLGCGQINGLHAVLL